MMIRSERNGVREEERKQEEEQGNHCNCRISPLYVWRLPSSSVERGTQRVDRNQAVSGANPSPEP